MSGLRDSDRDSSHQKQVVKGRVGWFAHTIASYSQPPGKPNYPEPEYEEIWPFNEAPRHLRVKAIDKLPDLSEALIPATDATTARLKEKVAPAKDLAAAVSAILNPKKK